MIRLDDLSKTFTRSWDSISNGWNHLARRASNALTRFHGKTEDEDSSIGVTRWGLLSADVFDDDRGRDEGSSLYTAFRRFTEGLFKAAGPEYLETGTGLGSCTLYDRQTNTQWDWDNLDGDFEWVKKDPDPGFLDIIFDRFNNLTKLSLT